MNNIKQIQTSIGEIHLWEVENYSARITAGEKKRIIEQAEIRNKLKELGYSNELLYKENGQPYLKDLPQTFLSISHSNGQMTIYIATKPCGVDIEDERKSMYEGRNYFVNERETLLDLTQETLQLIWGAKEALYKKMEGQITDLKNEVTFLGYNLESQELNLEYQKSEEVLKFLIEDKTYLIYSEN